MNDSFVLGVCYAACRQLRDVFRGSPLGQEFSRRFFIHAPISRFLNSWQSLQNEGGTLTGKGGDSLRQATTAPG